MYTNCLWQGKTNDRIKAHTYDGLEMNIRAIFSRFYKKKCIEHIVKTLFVM